MPKEATITPDDPFHGRRPTSHERMTGESWDASYRSGTAPWDIGRPQPAVVRLASNGLLTGSVLDAGCGAGDNTLYIASLGLPVVGIDVAETALAICREKAHRSGIKSEFASADAFHLERLGRSFETVLDCGLFHTFENDEQLEYARSLASVTKRNGTLYVLCFNDQGPNLGPHPVRQDELRIAFSSKNGWNVVAIGTERIETNYHVNGVSAWLTSIKRI